MKGQLDSLDLTSATRRLPEQMQDAVASAATVTDLPALDAIDHVVVMGMGGSGIAGDIVAAVAGPMMPVPVVVSKGYPCPGFVNPRSLVVAVSFSGETEETLEAAGEAEAAGAHMVVVTTGGSLGSLAAEWGSPVYDLDATIPMPRAAVGAVSVPVLMALDRIGLFPGAEGWISLAVRQLELRRTHLDEGGMAELVADAIGDTVPLIYGGGELGGVAATRWKNQVNENVKAPAFANEMPELCHNELAGWSSAAAGIRDQLTLVNLRHDHEHPQISRRFEFTDREARQVMSSVLTVEAEGDGQLAQLFDLMYIGDHVSLELASARGVDPGPIDALVGLKQFLVNG